MNLLHRNALIAQWKREEQQPFSGWDFSYLHSRMTEEQPPWSYTNRVIELMRQSSAVLDMGTGGGEQLLDLREHWPARVVATEDYPPNVKLAAERLTPPGAQVIKADVTDDGLLPLPDGAFDLVINRHSAFNAREVARVLAPGGTFLTQQVHGLWAEDLHAAFGTAPLYPNATPQQDVPRLQAAGMKIVHVEEWAGMFTFADIGALVYYLKAMPWVVPNFSVDTYVDNLMRLQAQLERGEKLAFTDRKYIIEAQKLDEKA
jgi:SAM-dependent methyltransferase